MLPLLLRFIFLLLCVGGFSFFASVEAQILPGLLKDTAEKKAEDTTTIPVVTTDTSLWHALNTVETYTLTLNRDISILRRGLDTSEISRELPRMENILNRFKRTLDSNDSKLSLRNLMTYRVALSQIDKQVAGHQEQLMNYSRILANIKSDIRAVKDSIYFTEARDMEDSAAILSYNEQMIPVVAKKAVADSLHRSVQEYVIRLQGRVTAAFLACSGLLEEVNYEIRNLQSKFYVKDQPYLWDATGNSEPRSIKSLITREFRRNLRVTRFYLSLNTSKMILIILATVALLWLTRYSYRTIQVSGRNTKLFPIHYLNRSMLGSILIILFTLAPFILSDAPAVMIQLMWFFMLITATAIRWADWNPEFRRYWIFMILFFFVYGVDNFLLQYSLGERIVLLILNVLAIVLSGYMYKEVRKDLKKYHPLMEESVLFFMFINILALFMNVLGRFTVAKALSNSSVLSIVLLLSLQIIKDIIFEYVFLLIEFNKNSRFSGFLEYNRIKEGFKNFISLAIFIIWILAFAWSLNFGDIIIERTEEFLQKTRKLGEITYTFSSILIFVVILWMSSVIGSAISAFFKTESTISTSGGKRIGSWALIIRLFVYTAGFLIAIGAAGIPLDKFTIIIGALGVGIGFGLQTITNNLISGIILAFERPIRVGDVIDIGNKTGTVKEIGIRSSKIAMFDGSDVIVPNGDLLSQQLVNWTHDNLNKRNELVIGVAYGTDLEKARRLIEASMKDREEMMQNPAPSIFLHEFANSSVNFRIFFWARDIADALKLKSDVMNAIYKSFAENNIGIPFPQTDLHIRSIDTSVIEELKDELEPRQEIKTDGSTEEKNKGETKPDESRNQ